jgi:hypothetical protein
MSKPIFWLLMVFAALVAPAREKPENWLEVRSPHFIVLSDSNEKQARHVADQFERMRTGSRHRRHERFWRLEATAADAPEICRAKR